MSAIETYLAKPWLTHYQKGVPATVEVPLKSVAQAFDEATERAPDRPAVVFYGRSISYRELRDATDRLACALAELGVKKGDRVALYLLNSPQFIIAYFAALKCGATVTPISPVYTSHEVRYQLEDSGARAIVCQDILYEKVEKSGAAPDLVVANVNEYLPALKRLFGKKAQVAGKVHWLQDLLKKYPAQPPAVTIDPKKDLAALPYTGGTTGNPKGVMLTHYNLVAAQAMGQAAFPVFEQGKEVILAFLPFFHIYGQVVIMLQGLCQGHLLVLFTSPDTEAILDAMERYGATVFYGVPTLYEYLKDHKDTNKANWKRLKLSSRRRHAARVDDARLDAAHRIHHHGGLRALRNLRHQPHQPAAPDEDRLLRLPDTQHAGGGHRPRVAGVRASERDRRARAVRPERHAGLLAARRGDRARVRRQGRRALDAHRGSRAHGR
jgi:long-chain acyl-CoA synthetase